MGVQDIKFSRHKFSISNRIVERKRVVTIKKQYSFHFRPGLCSIDLHMSLVARKLVTMVSDMVRHKPGCTVTENGYRLEILDLESRKIVLHVYM